MKNTFAIIGRPNVGKSTFFNRLVGGRFAITANEPGTTRDRKIGQCHWRGKYLNIIDTGGYETKKATVDQFRDEISKQIEFALSEADGIFFLVDSKLEISSEDLEIAKRIRQSGKRIYLIVNKIDHISHEFKSEQFKKLGIEKIYTISAITGRGVGDLLDDVFKNITTKIEKQRKPDLKIVIVGRPNVGKSSLINKIIGSERVIASNVAGTTRDSVDISFNYNNRRYVLVDTAGIRKRGKIAVGVEKFSVERAVDAIYRSDVAILVADAEEGLTRGDAHIADLCLKKKKPLLIVINKTDLVSSEKDIPNLYRFHFINKIDTLLVSALTGKNVVNILDWLEEKVADSGETANENR